MINQTSPELRARIRIAEAGTIIGRCIEVGDDDEGQPRLVIHTTREQLAAFKRNLAYVDVAVSLAEKTLNQQP